MVKPLFVLHHETRAEARVAQHAEHGSAVEGEEDGDHQGGLHGYLRVRYISYAV